MPIPLHVGNTENRELKQPEASMKYLCTENTFIPRKLLDSKDIKKQFLPKVLKRYKEEIEAKKDLKSGQWIIKESDNSYARYSAKEGHCTVYKFPKEMEDYMALNKGSTAGYIGSVHTDWFYMDFDKRDDIHGCLVSISPLLDYLKDNKIYHILMFSGTKGFHLYIPIGYIQFDSDLKDKANIVCQHFFDQLRKQFPTISKVCDNIYTNNHLLRLPYTLNTNKNINKLKRAVVWKGVDSSKPWSEWLDSTPSSKDVAEIYYDILFNPKIVDKPNWKLDTTIKMPEIKRSKAAEKYDHPYKEKACIYKMMNDTNPDQRFNTAMRIMEFWREKGLHKDIVYKLLLKWREALEDTSDFHEKEIVNVIKSYGKYPYSCTDSIKQKYCVFNSSCSYYKTSKYENTVSTSSQSIDSYVSSMNESTSTYLYLDKIFDKLRVVLKPSRGHIMTIIGASGVGKTIAGLIIMVKANHLNWVFFSYEMGKDEITERLAVMLGLDLRIPGDRKKYKILTAHIFIVDDQTISIQGQSLVVAKAEEITGRKIHATMSDYLQIIPVEEKNNKDKLVSNPTQCAREISFVAKGNSKKNKHLSIFMAQPTKEMSQGGNTEINQEDARDGQSIQAMSDSIMTLWRPHYHRMTTKNGKKVPMIDNVTTLFVCKDRHGVGHFMFDYDWIPNQLMIGGLYQGSVSQQERKIPGR